MSDVERGIRNEIYRSLVLLGADSMLLASAASWANGADDDAVLADVRNWNEAKLLELKEWLPTMTGRQFEAVQEQIRQYEEARAALRQAA
ncbi:MAG: hypothetical protein EPO20_16000 [Betaproteobacteria bacterium]|nr:MAG: hypothetical protein EPO20_16000 [Betaproteobacteria bacterium]